MRVMSKAVMAAVVLLSLWATASSAAGCSFSALEHNEKLLQGGAEQNLCKQYGGKVVLIVNTASRGKHVDQYRGLQKLYAKYKDQGLVVLAFPSDDFDNLPLDNKKLIDLTRNTYGVRFPVFQPIHVTGPHTDYLYRDLFLQAGVPPNRDFDKYLIGRDGDVVGYYAAQVTPHDASFVSVIEDRLSRPVH